MQKFKEAADYIRLIHQESGGSLVGSIEIDHLQLVEVTMTKMFEGSTSRAVAWIEIETARGNALIRAIEACRQELAE